MSRAATDWAWSLRTASSSEKLVLLALADRADEYHQCFPSIQRLAGDTNLNRKTIMNCIKNLIAAGLVTDTGMRRGLTGQVKVYQLGVDSFAAEQAEAGQRVPKTEQSQKRNSTESGTVPLLPSKSPKNGTGKSTKNGTQNQSLEPVNEPEREPAPEQAAVLPCPDDQFEMTLDWEPDVDRLAQLSRLAGLAPEAFTPELVGHFKIYYEASHRVQNSARWHRDLISWARREQVMQARRPAVGASSQLDPNDTSWIDGIEGDLF